MKLNKIITLTALAAGGLVACGSAYGLDPAANSLTSMTTNATSHVREPNINKMSKELNLSDSQKPQVQSALSSERQQMRDVHKDTSLSKDQKRSKMTEIRDGMNTKMKSILTPDQYSKWQKMTQSHHGMHHRTPPAGSTQ